MSKSVSLNLPARQFVAELVGTFMLVFIGAGSAAVGGLTLVDISLAFGFIVTAAIYAVGNISGCHINPAVTLSLWINGHVKLPTALMYIIAQTLGAIAAGLAIFAFMGTEHGMGVTGLAAQITPMKGMLIEALGTFILVFTVYGSAVGAGKTQLAGIVIGLVVSAVIFTIGPLTNSAINPARAFGPALISGNFTNLWVYLVGPTLGGIVAGFLFKFLNPVTEKDG